MSRVDVFQTHGLYLKKQVPVHTLLLKKMDENNANMKSWESLKHQKQSPSHNKKKRKEKCSFSTKPLIDIVASISLLSFFPCFEDPSF